MKPVIAMCLVMIPALAFAQHRSGGEGFSGGGGATSSGGSGGGSSSSGGSGDSSFSGGSGGGNSIGGMSIAVHRPPNVVVPSNSGPANASNGTFTNYSNLSPTAPEFARPRGSLPINMAFPRGSVPSSPIGDGGTIIIGYNPWLYAYGGLAYSPFYGEFDPFFFDYGYAPLSTTSSATTPSNDEKGVLHFKVKPRKAEVYIDGTLVGNATDFEGLFHKLKLDPGVHRVELRAPGYAPLLVNVRIQPGQSVTYRGELEKDTR
jgi:PEGA domain